MTSHGFPSSDDALAVELARTTGEMLLALREEMELEDPNTLRAAGDKRAHDLLVSELHLWRPADVVLSEEGGPDDGLRLESPRVWIVDPLDGTREYGEAGRADWAVHVALWQRDGQQGGRLVTGAVALPARRLTFGRLTVDRHVGPPGRPIRIATSRTRPPSFLPALAQRVGAQLVPMGSAGAKIVAVIRGEVDAYIHAGGQYEWDSAAPVALAEAAGVHASRIDGSPLRYNQPDPSLPDLLVCHPALTDQLLAALEDRHA
jgi:3'(2'), 5'-bisphosphate nucleotidase